MYSFRLRTVYVFAVVTFWMILCGSKAQNDPCKDFIYIGNERRSVTYKLTETETPFCDIRLSNVQWYSFEQRTGSMIPEVASVQYGFCGTISPIFVIARNDSVTYHEAAKTGGTDILAPVRSTDGGLQGNITIHYCKEQSTATNDVFVYKLAAPGGCDLAYCAGNGTACPAGTYWNGIQGICIEGFPAMNGPPQLTGPKISRMETVPGLFGTIVVKQFSFYCHVSYSAPAIDNGARFKVQLYFNNKLAPRVTVPIANATHPTAQIEETLLKGNLGKFLTCSARSFWYGNKNPEMSSSLRSNSYWVGIKSTVDQVNVVDGPTTNRRVNITYNSTVPITCWHCYTSRKPICVWPCVYNYTVGRIDGMDKMERTLTFTEALNRATNPPSVVLEAQITITFPQPITYYNVWIHPMTKYIEHGDYVLWKDYVIPNVIVGLRRVI